ncbi:MULTISPECIES: hypothetical protein [unclassified Haladaptatus]|uniref:hypothetical protein n=1 Tax=unclassified Haladaptatus TaxID=2622732 RepID=UPI0023E84BD8|nr:MULTISPECIES: hypothetical protein [unclassified Haladaptatus]
MVAVPIVAAAVPVFGSALRSVTDIVPWRNHDDSENIHAACPILVAHVVKRVPPDTIVSNSWADPIKDCRALQYILREAFLSQKVPKLVLTKSETVHEVKHVLSLLPYTEGEEENERDGYYVNTSQGVVVLTLEDPLKNGK